MRVVWAYRTYGERCDIITNPWETFIFKVSIMSWMKYAPQVKRVLYCDEKVHQFLTEKNYLKYLDEIILVDFEEAIDRRYPKVESFFAYPKIWAMTQQIEPFFICDTDGVLRCNISEWFDEKEYYAVWYPREIMSRTPDYTPENALCKLSQICTSSPALQSFCDYTDTINAGLLYFPDVKVAQIVGHMILTLGTDIQEGLEKSRLSLGQEGDDFVWTLYEESLLNSLITTISKKEIQKVKYEQFEECSGINGTEGWMEPCVQTAVNNLNFKFLIEEYEEFKKTHCSV